jgi:hypothetical protein
MKIRKTLSRSREALDKIRSMCDMIETGCSEEDVFAFKCPICGAKMEIVFDCAGRLCLVVCSSEPDHGGLQRWCKSPPTWWQHFPTARLRLPPVR